MVSQRCKEDTGKHQPQTSSEGMINENQSGQGMRTNRTNQDKTEKTGGQRHDRGTKQDQTQTRLAEDNRQELGTEKRTAEDNRQAGARISKQ
jgi:hypothetical protein